MPKRIQKKTKHTKSILTAVGIFTAGSIFGAVVHGPSVSTVDELPVSYSSESISSEFSAESSVHSLSIDDEGAIAEMETTFDILPIHEEPSDNEVAPEIITESENIESIASPEDFLFGSEWMTDEETEVEAVTITEPGSVIDKEPDWEWGEWDTVSSESATEDSIIYEPIYEESVSISDPVEEDDWMKTEDTDTAQPVVILHEDSSMTPALIEQLEGTAFFWAPSGNKIHINPTCRSFKKGYTFAGTLDEAQSVRTDGWCGICSKNAASSTSNSYAAAEILAACYTYSDFLAGIPADAFGG